MTSPTRMLLPVVACAAVVGYWATPLARADDVPEVERLEHHESAPLSRDEQIAELKKLREGVDL